MRAAGSSGAAGSAGAAGVGLSGCGAAVCAAQPITATVMSSAKTRANIFFMIVIPPYNRIWLCRVLKLFASDLLAK
ncbi:hypothetical protein SDC9_116087 [bioreactor metagenome]|uniref:Lipoprotein n=1 Tax=bioreactor metagenome TaxID=1076179 RepID=A0A645C1C5_9ZZZZ